MTDPFLTRLQALTRISRGDTLYMEHREGMRCWWFDGPYEEVGDDVIQEIAFKPGRVCELVEHGDSLFGEVNSQSWKGRMMPKRIQRKRTKGWTMPEGTVYVGRPTRWGNPFDWRGFGREQAVDAFRSMMEGDIRANPNVAIDLRTGLTGRDLACWCPLDQPCHADVLLEMANS